MDFGLSLRKAHQALNRLAEAENVAVELDAGDVSLIAARLKALGVEAARVVLPTPDIQKIREKLGVSQAEFATRFGLELDTRKTGNRVAINRTRPRGCCAKRSKLHPEVVAGVLAGEGVAI